MKIATVATGGIGGYLAVKLAKQGHKIATVARGTHLDAIKLNGLKLVTSDNVEIVKPWKATSNTKEIGPVDAIIFGVKANDLKEAGKACIPMLNANTLVVPFLNGVEAASRLLEVLPRKNVVNGTAKISTTIQEPGVVKQTGSFAHFIFAELDSKPSPRIQKLQNAFKNAGICAPKTNDIDRDLWSKFVLFSSMSGITAAARCTIGDLRASNELTAFCQSIMAETAMVGRRIGINLSDSLEASLWEVITSLPADMRTSMAIDLKKNRPLEVEWISGAVVRLARAAGVDAPLNQAIYALLSIYEKGKNN